MSEIREIIDRLKDSAKMTGDPDFLDFETQGWVIVVDVRGQSQIFILDDTNLKVVVAYLDGVGEIPDQPKKETTLRSTVTAHSLSVRVAGDIKSERVGFVYFGDTLEIFEIVGKWARHDQGGWSHTDWMDQYVVTT